MRYQVAPSVSSNVQIRSRRSIKNRHDDFITGTQREKLNFSAPRCLFLQPRTPEIFRHLRSHAPKSGRDFAGAQKRSLHMRKDVFASDVTQEIRLQQKLCGLVASPAKQQRPAGFPQPVGKYLKSMQPRRIDRRHVAQPDDYNGRKERKVFCLLR